MSKYAMAIDLRRCAGCGGCVVACQMSNNTQPDVSWNMLDCCEWGTEPGASGRSYVPHACMQCENAPCVEVCPTGASTKEENGVVLVNYKTCIGCRTCVDACPYDARKMSGTATYVFGAAEPAPYEAYGVQREKVAEKCTFCIDLVEKGGLPACVVNCPGKARYFGDLDDAESDISKFLAANPDTMRVDETSFYYFPVSGTPDDAISKIVHKA